MTLKRIILAAAIGLQLASSAAAQTVYSTPYIGDRVIYVDTVDDMLALPAGKSLNGQVVVTKRYSSSHTAGDGSGNAYRSDTSEGGTPDGGFVINDTGTHWHAVDKTVANVMQFGAVGDGATDDSARLVAWAAASCRHYVLPQGTYMLDDATIAFAADDALIECQGTISATEGWYAKAAVSLTGDRQRIVGLVLREANASPTNSAKNAAANVGISVAADDVTVERCVSEGFCFPFACRGIASDYPGLRVVDCDFAGGYAWAEIDSVTNATLLNSIAHNNGLDGWKVQNEYSRTCDGLTITDCVGTANGQRDTAAGGSETANGNGFDLYTGGYRFSLSGCRAYANYGSGFVQKGGNTDPTQGEGTLTNCRFDGNLATSSGSVHGIELNDAGGNGGSLLTILGGSSSNNASRGVYVGGGFAVRVQGLTCVNNGGGGMLLLGRDISVDGAAMYGNTGDCIVIGEANTAAYASKRVRITNTVISGNYDDSLAASVDPRTAATTKNTSAAIRTYSDSADIAFQGVEVYNCANATASVILYSGRTTWDGGTVYGADSCGIAVFGGESWVRDVTIEETDFSSSQSRGSIYAGTGGVLHVANPHLIQSSSTANTEGINWHSGSGGGSLTGKVEYTNFPIPVSVLGSVRVRIDVNGEETVTASAPTLSNYLPVAKIDSSSNAVNATLGSGTFAGQTKTIVMTDASSSSTVSVTNHVTSDPEVFTFDAVDEYLVLIWTGTEWVTVSGDATTWIEPADLLPPSLDAETRYALAA